MSDWGEGPTCETCTRWERLDWRSDKGLCQILVPPWTRGEDRFSDPYTLTFIGDTCPFHEQDEPDIDYEAIHGPLGQG